MFFNIEELQPTKMNVNLESYTNLGFGKPKVGKTTFMLELLGKTKTIMITTEDRYKHIEGAYVVRVHSIQELQMVLSQLQNPKSKEKFDNILIDGVGALHTWCERKSKSDLGVEELSDVAHGSGWSKAKDDWNKIVSDIANSGYQVSWISHEKEKQVKIAVSEFNEDDFDESSMQVTTEKKTGNKFVEYTKYEPDLPARGLEPIKKIVDNILFMHTGESDKRYVELRETSQWVAGCTFGDDVPSRIELNAEVYKETMKKHLKDQVSKLGEDKVEQEKFEPSEELEVLSFEDNKKEIDEMAQVFKEKDDIKTFLKIIASHIGEGNLVRDMKESQNETLHSILIDLKESVGE